MNLPNEGESLASSDAAGGDSQPPKQLGDLHKTITMAQIAKAAGVSQGAISSLLNDRDYGIRVSEKTRERVFKVCREMGYIPNDLRAVVRMYPEFGDYCLLLPAGWPGGLADPLVARLAAAVMSAGSDPSRPLTLAFYEETRDYLAAGDALPLPVRAGVCSKFLVFGPPNLSLFQALSRRGSPAISLGYEAAQPGVFSLVPDYAAASRLALEHLHGLGHRQLGIVSGPFGATDAKQLELNRGASLACAELQIPGDAPRIVHGDLSEAAGRAAFDELFAHTPSPTAVYCMSDAAAAGLLGAALARGIRIPEQLSLIGCGGDPVSGQTHPTLSTIELPVAELALQGVREIDRRVRATVLEPAGKSLLPVRLLPRASSAEGQKN